MSTRVELQPKMLRGMDSALREVILEALGLDWVGIVSGGKHIILRSPDGLRTIVTARTPSDHRAHRNARARLNEWKRLRGSM